MELRLIVLFLCAVCCVTEAQLPKPTALTSSITRTGCGTTKLCVSSSDNCDPSGNSSCYFSSTQFSNGILTVELSGTTSGYVGFGLTVANPQVQALIQAIINVNANIVFVCGDVTSGNFSFQPAIQFSTQLNPVSDLNTFILSVTSVSGSVTPAIPKVQCVFNIRSPLFSLFPSLPLNITILNGTELANPSTVFNSNGPLDLTDPGSNVPNNVTIASLNITRDGCGVSKLCFPVGTCDLTGSTNCFFASVQVKNQTFTFELSGTTSGYVALGLTKAASTFVFVCGNNSTTKRFFFRRTIGTSLSTADVATVYNSQGAVGQSLSVIQCIFNTSTSFSVRTDDDTLFNLTIMTGTIDGSDLRAPVLQYDSKKALNLSDPSALNSSNSIIGHWTQVVAVLLSALILHLL